MQKLKRTRGKHKTTENNIDKTEKLREKHKTTEIQDIQPRTRMICMYTVYCIYIYIYVY